MMSPLPSLAQLDEFYHFFEPYFTNQTALANQNVKRCKEYVEFLTDSVPTPLLLEDYRFDTLGRLSSNRSYHVLDSMAGYKMIHTYNSNGTVNNTRWTWFDNNDTQMATYYYDSLGKLMKVKECVMKGSKERCKKSQIIKIKYSREGKLSYARYVKDKEKIIIDFVYRNDTVFMNNKTKDWHFTYKNGLLVKEKSIMGDLIYEYNAEGQLTKSTQTDVWDRIICTETYNYTDGLITSIVAVINNIDDTIIRRRTFEYERY